VIKRLIIITQLRPSNYWRKITNHPWSY